MSNKTKKLSGKILASYALYQFAFDSMWMLNNYFLLFFYTDVIKIPAAAATVIFLIARVWDTINDPMMGVIVDKTRSKEGKSRFWLKRLSVPCGVFVSLCYICPSWATPGRIFWAGVVYILLGMAQTAVGIPTASLQISITQDRSERVRLQQTVAIPSAVSNALIPAVTMPFVRSFGENRMMVGFFVLAVMIGILVTVSSLIIYHNTKGLDPDTSKGIISTTEDKSGQNADKSIGAFQLIKSAAQNKYCILVVLICLMYMLLSGIVGSSLVFYARYNMKNEGLMSIYSIGTVIGMLLGIATMRVLARRFGNATTIRIGAILFIVSSIPRILFGDGHLTMFAVCMVVLGSGSSYIVNMLHQCKLDAATYGQLQGDNNPSVVISLYTFAQKFGQAVSSVIASGLLALFHYTGGQEPTPAVLKLFYAESVLFPAVVALAVLFVSFILSRMEKELVNKLTVANTARA